MTDFQKSLKHKDISFELSLFLEGLYVISLLIVSELLKQSSKQFYDFIDFIVLHFHFEQFLK